MALERGILDSWVTGSDPAFGQRWYEVVDYMNGPVATFTTTNIVINDKVWGEMPPDLQ
ncbi:MAG: hypothetical protein IH962_04900 [Chloroflexi bacterium]|nr:hypothetical protein [Chloroflexota bacterium]